MLLIVPLCYFQQAVYNVYNQIGCGGADMHLCIQASCFQLLLKEVISISGVFPRLQVTVVIDY